MKTTKKTFILSVLSIVLCVAMFLGTTFAWFTDNATSGANKIVAGNLDIEVSYKDDTEWKSIQNATDLFDPEALWEPGHTEYIILKVENKGTLRLKYKLMVTPVSEVGGINVDGQMFKLSDYLMFGSTAPSATEPTYASRDDARDVVTATATGFDQAALQQSNDLAAGAYVYVTIVVYMPDNIGNAANYKTGTVPPSIDLGIKVVATQTTGESDSFEDNYDSGAASDGTYVVGPAYDYYPQIVKSVPVATDGATNITATGKLKSTDTDEVPLATVTVPAAAVDTGVTELTLKVVPKDPSSDSAAGLLLEINNDGRETANFDIKVEGVKTGNTEDITVELFVGKALANVKLYHNGEAMTGYTYNAGTGVVSFSTKSFSDYTVAYNVVAACIGDKTYASLNQAIDAVQNGETIVVLRDVDNAVGISVASGKNFIVDFGGHTYTLNKPGAGSAYTKTIGFQLLKDSTIVFKNGTINCAAENKDAVNEGDLKPIKMIIQNYANLTLDRMTLDGTNLAHNTGVAGYIMSNNSGEVVIKNSTIKAISGDFAFDSCEYASYAIPTVTLNNATIDGTVELTGGKLAFAGDVTLGGRIEVHGDYTIDLNGKKITRIGAGGNGSAFDVKSGNVTIKNGTIDCTPVTGVTQDRPQPYDTEVDAITVRKDADVTLENLNVTVVSTTGACAYAFDGGKITILSGKYTNNANEVFANDNQMLLNQADNKPQAIFVKGGTFVGANPADGDNSGNPASFLADGYGCIDGTVYQGDLFIGTADELVAFAKEVNGGKTYSGKTVVLTADIDLAGIEWTPIGRTNRFEGTFDGQNHTIKNLTSVLDSTSATMYGNGLFGDITGGAVLKNFVVDNANVYDKVDGKGNVYGIVCGYAYGTVTFENITVKNSKVSAFGKVGAILGMAADPNGTTTIKNCKVLDTEITGAYNCATFAGLTQNTVSMSGNTQSNVTYKYSSRYGAEVYIDLDTTAANGDSVKGKYWKYLDDYYMAGWATQYNELKESTIESETIGIDAIVHN